MPPTLPIMPSAISGISTEVPEDPNDVFRTVSLVHRIKATSTTSQPQSETENAKSMGEPPHEPADPR